MIKIFVITTEFEHERKIDGTTAHVLSGVHSSKNKDNIFKIISNHLAKKDWKFGLEQMTNYVLETTRIPENEIIIEKIIRFFEKNKKGLQKKI